MNTGRDVLGDGVIPLSYTLRFEPDLESFVYQGSVSIHVSIIRETKEIQLNASGLKIKNAEIVVEGEHEKAAVKVDAEMERIVLLLRHRIRGSAVILLEFEGRNEENLYGFYRSRYNTEKGEGSLLTTQFEAANARNAFPCFDEPALKARFGVSVLVENDLECVSNMPIKGTVTQGQKKLVTFHTTPKMSTYLLYLGVGHYERLSGRHSGTKISVLTTPGKEGLAAVALEYAKRFIMFYEHYFGIRYPLPKIDLLAIPDFAARAMENWGAITFRETDLLCDEDAAVVVKQHIAEVVAHELAHQWFGDLVTMKWWNDLWLNESFATFMSFKAMDAVFPSWNMRAQYLDDTISVAFSADQLKSTHPISVEVRAPSEIDQIFDEISYDKGGTILNMLEDYVGRELFRKGLRQYLKKHAYSNAEQSDLWEVVGKASGNKRVREVAECWINKAGYPIVKAVRHGDHIRVTQERFCLSECDVKKEKWLIPVHLARLGSRHTETRLLMSKGHEKVEGIGKSAFKLNYGQTGLYRVMYQQEELEALGDMIKNAELSNIDAWGIENDLYALAIGRRISAAEYLDFVEKYCFAANYPLNIGVLSHLRRLFNVFYNSTKQEQVGRLLGAYGADVIKQIGWIRSENEYNTTTMVRSSAVFALGLSGDKSTLNRARRLFEQHMGSGSVLDANLRGAVYSLVALKYGAEAAPVLRERYEKEVIPEEKFRLLAAMGMLGESSLASKAMAYSLSGRVRLQDSYIIPAVAASNPEGKKVVWGWTKKNWKALMKRYGSGTHMLEKYVSNMRYAQDYATLRDVKAFFSIKENTRKDIGEALAKTLETIRINADFLEFNAE